LAPTKSHASGKIKKRKPTPRFRQRYEVLEAQRAALLKRLARVREAAHKHSGFGTASTLLNQRFRKASLLERMAILQSAAWMIDVLERLASIM